MAEKNKPSAELAAELKAAAEAVRPQRQELQAKVNELVKQAEPLYNDALRMTEGWRFEDEWPLAWIMEGSLYVSRGYFYEDGISFEVDYASHLLPYEVLDNIEATVAEGWALLTKIRGEIDAKNAKAVEGEREQLLARLAEIDAQVKEK